jgi:hypothetical protein
MEPHGDGASLSRRRGVSSHYLGRSLTTSDAAVTVDAPGLPCKLVVTVTEADASSTLEATRESVGV